MAIKILKFLGAGLVAILLLCLILAFYVYYPIHVANPRKNTDYVWSSGAIYFKTSEGIGWGRFDDNGFNNVSVIESPDVLVLGSSHMEASYVLQSENATAVLNNLFKNRMGGGQRLYGL